MYFTKVKMINMAASRIINSYIFVLRIRTNSGKHYYLIVPKPCKNPRDKIYFYLAMLQLYKLKTS